MEKKYNFKDEWLLQVVINFPAITLDFIEILRKQHKPYLSEALIEAQLTAPETILEAVYKTYNIPYFDYERYSVDRLALSLIPEKICRRYQLIPFRIKNDFIEVAMLNPLDVIAKSDIIAVSGRTPKAYYCLPSQIESMIAEYFNPEILIYNLLDQLNENTEIEILQGASYEREDNNYDTVRTPIIKLVNSLIVKALHMRASDIHIEHEERTSLVRFRIDGLLRNIITLPRNIATGPVVSRIKIMTDLDMAEHFRPQEGRAKLLIEGNEIGLRVSILPTSSGEKIVIRILDPKAAQLSLEELGFRPQIATRLKNILKKEQGVILVTGPVGSGKSTTLYSIINMMKTEKTNIITVEDPIEYKFEGINQVQVNEKQGLNYPAVLRSVLRQDPDIILAGEIHDVETVEIIFQAAMTGHLVFSTLHTNNTLSTVTRLLDMGVEKYKLASGIIAIITQRLVRRLCPFCREIVPPEQIDLNIYNLLNSSNLPTRYYKNIGCSKCDYNGYKGRIAVFELLEIDPVIKNHIISGGSEEKLSRLAHNNDALYTMLSDVLWHLSKGDTSLEEIYPHINIKDDNLRNVLREINKETAIKTELLPENSQVEQRRILITDDDPSIRIILKKYLQDQGYHVYEAVDGVQALDFISKNKTDLVLLDLMMPKLDGYGVIQEVREGFGRLKIPIIVLTSIDDEKSQEQAINLGVYDYIIKPFKPALVVARVSAFFRRLEQYTQN